MESRATATGKLPATDTKAPSHVFNNGGPCYKATTVVITTRVVNCYDSIPSVKFTIVVCSLIQATDGLTHKFSTQERTLLCWSQYRETFPG